MRRNRSLKNGTKLKRLVPVILVCMLAAVGVLVCFRMQTCLNFEVLDTVAHEDVSNGTYLEFGDLIVRYTGNGITAMDQSMKELWDVSYEIQNPFVDVCGGSLAVADLEGNQIYVFDRKGLAGTITARMPIQKLSVSGQGIVAVVMKNDARTMFELYAPDGTELVEGKVSLSDTGYPLAIDLSDDGRRLLVSYLKAGTQISSTVVCYDFSDADAAEQGKKILEETYDGTLIPTVVFLDRRHAAAAGTDRIMFYQGKESLKENRQIVPDGEIRSLMIDDGRISAVEDNPAGEDTYVCVVYGKSGRTQRSWTFDGEYQEVLMHGRQILFRNETRCVICRFGGHELFRGSFDTAPEYLVPVRGFHKYLMIGSDTGILFRIRK